MRATSLHATADHPLLDDALKSGTGAAQPPLFQQSLRDYLPPWLGGNENPPDSLLMMLRTLKTATESYLEAPLSAAEIVFPFPVSSSYLDTLRAACFSLGLHMPMSAQPPAGITAATARRIGGKCNYIVDDKVSEQNQEDDPAQLILTVDYSRAALTTLLVVEECGVFEVRRVVHDTNLGTDVLAKGSDNSGSCSTKDGLTNALHNVTHLPLKDGNGAELTKISELVMLGESASNQRLINVLKDVLADQSNNLVATMDARQVGNMDPVFAASRGVAWDCWDRLNFERSGDGQYSL